MALTVTQLNGDSSFLLALEPLVPDVSSRPFYVLIDPWLSGPSIVLHSQFSITSHKDTACISSLVDLPEPDLVIISQARSDHLNPTTLRQLPPRGTKTTILAEPSAARKIRSWKYFDDEKVVTLSKWEHHGKPQVIRMPVDIPSGKRGEVTVAFIPQQHDISRLHAAIAITYRPPIPLPHRSSALLLTPPATPRSQPSSPRTQASTPFLSPNPNPNPNLLPPTPPASITNTHRHSQSISSLAARRLSTPSLSSLLDRPLSIIYSPHGIKYSSLHSYVTRHLVSEAALPLTALLHCFNSVSNRWLGNILQGAPSGMEIATRLGARAWFSTHDGNKVSGGLLAGLLKTTRFRREDIEVQLRGRGGEGERAEGKGLAGTAVVELGIGEGVTVTGEGVAEEEEEIKPTIPDRRSRCLSGESWLDLDDEDSEEEQAPASPSLKYADLESE